MKAVRINQWGQPAQVEEIPQQTPQGDEVLVRVHAAALNPIDSIIAAGYLASMVSVPMTAGTDFAGEVVAVGKSVSHVKPGDAVYGTVPIRCGTFAEFVNVKGHEVAVKPQSLDYIQASSVPLAALAAWLSLIDFAQVQPGERVLIHGASGSVGSFAIQLAEDHGAHVIANSRPHRKAFLQELGADEIINSQDERFEEIVGVVDIVLNFCNSDLQERSYQVLQSGGRYATAFLEQPSAEAEARGVRTFSLATAPSVGHLNELARLIDAGKLKVFIDRTFPLEEAQSAMDYRITRTASGKVVLTV